MAERGLDVSRFQIPTHIQESLGELEQELAEGKVHTLPHILASATGVCWRECGVYEECVAC